MENKKDTVYSSKLDWVENFTFDASVANVFQDMITRSVPGYRTTLAMIGVIVDRFVTEGSIVYDLGCSLGAGTLIAANANHQTNYTVLGIDTSKPMLDQCQEFLQEQHPHAPVELKLEDIRETPIENASVVLLNFTLQFLPLEDRKKLLQRIFDGLNRGGVLVLSEKIHFETPPKEELLYELHHDFKRRNGYSDLEISQKRTALENTLITETMQTHMKRIRDVGFAGAYPWFQCFNFASLVAVKD
jgi:tRNA (cmo5U34)-methyltransferase